MVFIASLVAAILFVIIFRKPLQKVPIVFYIIAAVLVAYYVYSYFNGSHLLVWRYFLVAFQRCTISLAFLTIVMFIGVLPENGKLRAALNPIRRQLSITGCILAFGHIIVYISAYIVRYTSGFTALSENMIAALSIAAILTILLTILLVTSFSPVHKAMQQQTWKRIQKFSYIFYALVFVHILLVMVPSALSGATAIILNIAVYTVVFMLYTVLRITRYVVAKRSVPADKTV